MAATAPSPIEKKEVPISVFVPVELAQRFDELARRQERSRSQELRRAMRRHLLLHEGSDADD